MHMDVLVNHVSLNLGEHMFSVSIGIAIASYNNIKNIIIILLREFKEYMHVHVRIHALYYIAT